MSKEQYFKDKQSINKCLSNEKAGNNANIEQFTAEELEEIYYYLDVISETNLAGDGCS